MNQNWLINKNIYLFKIYNKLTIFNNKIFSNQFRDKFKKNKE